MTKQKGGNKYLQIIILYTFKNLKKRDMIYKKARENIYMKKLISLLLCAAFIYTVFLTSCQTVPEETSQPVTETVADVTETETREDGTQAETETETETEAETEAEPPSPYGMFTMADSPVNVTVTSPYAILIDAKTKEILYINCAPQRY